MSVTVRYLAAEPGVACVEGARLREGGAIGFVVGLAMFGALTFIPLFLQVVRGVTPTQSGLRLFPLMAGLFIAAIGSGQIISRWGRYKIFPIIGTGLATVGLYLMSHMGVDSPYWFSAAVTVIALAGTLLAPSVLQLPAAEVEA